MTLEVIAAAGVLSAASFAAGWLKSRVRLAACLREHQKLVASSLVTEFEKRLLELMARRTPYHRLLDNVTRTIEAMATECVCTVMLLDEEQRCSLHCASGPSLPPEYMQALSRLEIGPDVGACGSAAFRNQTVIVEDIASDYRFALARDFVLGFGLRSCWSVPIRNFNGVAQGTFAMYRRKPARPRPAELLLVEAGARLAGNVIERLRSEQRLREAAERLELAEKAAEFGIWEVHVPSGVVTFSEGFATLVGLSAVSRQLNLRELETMLYPDDRAAVRSAVEEALQTGTFQVDFRIVLPDRSIRWERGQGRVELTENGAKRAVGALIDISEEKSLLMRLEDARAAAEASAGVAQQAERLELDRKSVLELVAMDRPLEEIARAIALAISRQFTLCSCSVQMELTGNRRISASPLVPEQLARVLDRIPVVSICQTLSASVVTGLSLDPEWQQCIANSGGGPRPGYLASPILQNRLVAGMILMLLPAERIATVADGELLESWARFAGLAIERRGLYEQLSFRAQYDALTMLLNRASLYDRMDTEMIGANREGGGMAILYLDLDSFKEINDLYGHAAGDEVLRTVSQRVLQSIRRGDAAARIGGDEFVILLPGLPDRRDARRVAELIGHAVREPIEFEGRELHVGFSAGIAIYPDDGRHIDALLKIADVDMYRTKLGRSAPLRRTSRETQELEPAANAPPALGPVN